MTLKCCKHITLVSAMLLSLSLLTGCGGSNAVMPDEPELPVEEVKESFVNLDLKISVNNGNVPASRAFVQDPDDPFEAPASEYEMVHTLRVVIVRPDGKIEHNRMVNVRNTTNSDNTTYTITSSDIINDNLTFKVVANEKKKIYIFANEKAVNRNKTAEEQFDFTEQLRAGMDFPTEAVSNILIKRQPDKAFVDNGPTTPLEEKTFVPMSEFFDVDVPAASDIYPETYLTETLFITRSLIKFSFWAAWAGNYELANPPSLRGVKISNLADEGYYLPNNTLYDPDKEDESNRYLNGREIISFNTPEDNTSSSCTFFFNSPLKLTSTGEEKSPLIYLPESKISGEDSNYYLSLIFSRPDQEDVYESKPLEIKDIPRNTHVKINLLFYDHEIVATVAIVPYISVVLDPIFGFPEINPGEKTEPEN